MQKIIQGVSEGSISPLDLINGIGEHSELVKISTYPDPDLIMHDKYSEKEYFLEDKLDFSERYSVIFNAYIGEYGFSYDDELYRDLGDDRGLSYEIHSLNERQREVELRGVLRGGFPEIDTDAKANINLVGLLNTDYPNLSLYEELAIDAYLLETEENIKMAFFTYFSAIEAIVRHRLDVIQENIYTELHEALEHLSLDLKVRIVAKDSFSTLDLQTIPIWGEFQGILRDVKKIRNLIAHGKLEHEVTLMDLNKCISCYIVLYCFSFKNLTSFNEIIKSFKK